MYILKKIFSTLLIFLSSQFAYISTYFVFLFGKLKNKYSIMNLLRNIALPLVCQ